MAAFKEEIGAEAVKEIAAAVLAADHAFPEKEFCRKAMDGLEELELKARVQHLMAALRETLPNSYPKALALILKAMSMGSSPAKVSGAPDHLPHPAGLRGFAAWPMIDFVGEYGLEHPELSLSALPELTQYFSAEFAIRPFLIHHEKLALSHMKKWAAHENEHVRRLASEGSRPILPWGIRLPSLLATPQKALPILRQLPKDSSNYVRRSLANHLNDISKNHPDWVIAHIKKWGGIKLPWVRHALRTLIKNGHADVWPLLGYNPDLKLNVRNFAVSSPRVLMGEEVQFSIELELDSNNSNDVEPIVMDYRLHLVRSKGKNSIKVFKWKTTKLISSKTMQFQKRHSFRPVTTRRYYPGTHTLEVQVNGEIFAEVSFELI